MVTRTAKTSKSTKSTKSSGKKTKPTSKKKAVARAKTAVRSKKTLSSVAKGTQARYRTLIATKPLFPEQLQPTSSEISQNLGSYTAKINAKTAPSLRYTYKGSIPFGAHKIETFEFHNGLRLLVLEDFAAPVVAYHTWFRVGSRHEHEGKTGLAHLFEHLMFNETKHLPAGAFDRRLEEAGAHTNAATWNDWTFYYEEVPAEQLRLVVALEAERMQHLILRTPQVQSEKEVVANERRYRVEDDVDGAVNELLYKTSFTQHPYHHPTIGWMDDILGFTPEDCREFYGKYYAPNNATIVVVGAVPVTTVLELIQKNYASIPSSKLPEEQSAKEPEQTQERMCTIDKPTPTAKVSIGYRGPALGDPDHAPLSVLVEALFGGRSSRLYRELVTEQEIASDIAASVSSFRDPGLLEISMSAREGVTANRLLEAIDKEFDALKSRPVTSDERDRSVARTELGFLQGLETVGGRAEQIGFYDTVVGNPSGSLARLEALRRVTTPQLADVASKYLQRSNRTVVLVNPAMGTNSGETPTTAEESRRD